MARSYKKHHCIKDCNHFMKRYANKQVRQRLKNFDIMLCGNQYRRLVEQYDVCDWKFLYPDFEAWYRQELKFWFIWDRWSGEPFPDRHELIQFYKKRYVRK